jgi:hypothetical protein
MSTKETTKNVLQFTSPGTLLLWESIEKATKAFQENSKDKSADELRDLAARERIRMEVEREQARTQQEIAIANRIDNASEVEIEEFYDISGSGNVGAQGTTDGNTFSVSMGASGEGKKIVRRVYRFKGHGDR